MLTNRLDGSGAAPVNCLVTNPVYSHSGQHVLIPAGARVLGETRPVQALGETRLAVAFHRLLMPDGSTLRLDQFLGLNQIGDAGLRDKVNHHYWSTFGAAGCGRSHQRPGAVAWHARAMSGGTGDRTVIIAGGARRDVAGKPAGDEPIPEPAADHHDSRGTPREGVPDERPASCRRIRRAQATRLLSGRRRVQ